VNRQGRGLARHDAGLRAHHGLTPVEVSFSDAGWGTGLQGDAVVGKTRATRGDGRNQPLIEGFTFVDSLATAHR